MSKNIFLRCLFFIFYIINIFLFIFSGYCSDNGFSNIEERDEKRSYIFERKILYPLGLGVSVAIFSGLIDKYCGEKSLQKIVTKSALIGLVTSSFNYLILFISNKKNKNREQDSSNLMKLNVNPVRSCNKKIKNYIIFVKNLQNYNEVLQTLNECNQKRITSLNVGMASLKKKNRRLLQKILLIRRRLSRLSRLIKRRQSHLSSMYVYKLQKEKDRTKVLKLNEEKREKIALERKQEVGMQCDLTLCSLNSNVVLFVSYPLDDLSKSNTSECRRCSLLKEERLKLKAKIVKLENKLCEVKDEMNRFQSSIY